MADPQSTNDLAATFGDGGVALCALENAYSPTLVELDGDLGLDAYEGDR